MLDIIENIKKEYGEFARESTVTLKEEGDGYRLEERLENGDAGITVYFHSDCTQTGVVFNHGWKLEVNDSEYLGEACDTLIELLRKYGVPLNETNSNLLMKSKSYDYEVGLQ